MIVVGDVKGLNSALLIAEEAAGAGFEVDCVIDDVYKLNARSMLVLNSRKWGYDESGHEGEEQRPDRPLPRPAQGRDQVAGAEDRMAKVEC